MQESSRRGTQIAHIGIAVRGLDDSGSFYRDVLGLADVPLDDSDGAKIVGLAAGPSLVELLEAESQDSPIAMLCSIRGPGILSFILDVDCLYASLERQSTYGVR